MLQLNRLWIDAHYIARPPAGVGEEACPPPPATATTGAAFIQVPSQDPHGSSSTSVLVAVVCLVLTVVRRCRDCCAFKVPTQLNSMNSWCGFSWNLPSIFHLEIYVVITPNEYSTSGISRVWRVFYRQLYNHQDGSMRHSAAEEPTGPTRNIVWAP